VRDAAPLRAAAAARLAEGRTPAAIRHARDYLQAMGAAAPVVAYPLCSPSLAANAKGVSEIRVLQDADIASTARLTEGLLQHVHWAEPYRPPELRVLAMQGAAALAPNLLLTADQHLLVAVRHRDVARVSGPALYLPAPGNYAAWLFGSLPRLAAYAAGGDLDAIPIVLHGDVAAWHLDSLHAMGIERARLKIYAAQVRVECKELIYCTTSYFHHAPSVTGVRHVRARVLERLGSDGHAGQRLYLARRHAKDRPLLNEAEVITLFERHGFTAIDPEQHSFQGQVAYAAGAQVLAGPYGANLANLVFAGNAHKLLILGTKHQPEFARLASALNIPFWHTVPQAVQIREGRTISESMGFTADLAELERVLQAMLATP
jgi:hypothetical protein